MAEPSAPAALSGVAAEAGYQLLRKLGEGGMGSVYLARDEAGRELALKFLDDTEERSEQRFLREAEMLARLSAHPNIVAIHRYVDGPRPFMALTFVDGETLGDRLKRRPLAEHEALDLLARVADALTIIHAEGITHRDLKPANILLRASDGEVLLTDFGIARSADAASLTRSLEVVGTPFYMAPEQVEGDKLRIGPATDLWALGVLLFECLSGSRPFESSSTVGLISAICEAPTPSIEDRVAELSPNTVRLIDTCLSKSPAGRPPDAAAFAEACRATLRGEDGAALDALHLPDTRRGGRLRLTSLALMLLTVVILLAVVAIGIRRRNDRRRLALKDARRELRSHRAAVLGVLERGLIARLRASVGLRATLPAPPSALAAWQGDRRRVGHALRHVRAPTSELARLRREAADDRAIASIAATLWPDEVDLPATAPEESRGDGSEDPTRRGQGLSRELRRLVDFEDAYHATLRGDWQTVVERLPSGVEELRRSVDLHRKLDRLGRLLVLEPSPESGDPLRPARRLVTDVTGAEHSPERLRSIWFKLTRPLLKAHFQELDREATTALWQQLEGRAWLVGGLGGWPWPTKVSGPAIASLARAIPGTTLNEMTEPLERIERFLAHFARIHPGHVPPTSDRIAVSNRCLDSFAFHNNPACLELVLRLSRYGLVLTFPMLRRYPLAGLDERIDAALPLTDSEDTIEPRARPGAGVDPDAPRSSPESRGDGGATTVKARLAIRAFWHAWFILSPPAHGGPEAKRDRAADDKALMAARQRASGGRLPRPVSLLFEAAFLDHLLSRLRFGEPLPPGITLEEAIREFHDRCATATRDDGRTVLHDLLLLDILRLEAPPPGTAPKGTRAHRERVRTLITTAEARWQQDWNDWTRARPSFDASAPDRYEQLRVKGPLELAELGLRLQEHRQRLALEERRFDDARAITDRVRVLSKRHAWIGFEARVRFHESGLEAARAWLDEQLLAGAAADDKDLQSRAADARLRLEQEAPR